MTSTPPRIRRLRVPTIALAISAMLGAMPIQAAAEPMPLTALARVAMRQAGERAQLATPLLRSPPATPGVEARLPRWGAITPMRNAPDVFGSVALPIARTPLDVRWHNASAARLNRPDAQTAALLGALRNAATTVRAARVNAWVNTRVALAADRGDRWATAAETLRTQRGDCEDFAVAKLQLLRALGVADRDLYLVIAYDLVRRQDHAVLVVRDGARLIVLDSGTDRLLDAGDRADYRPIVSFSADRAWTHGYAATGGRTGAATPRAPMS